MPVIFISNTASGKYTVPSGAVILMNTATVPDGFTAYTALNGYYVAAYTSTGSTGGNASHSHTQTLSAISTAGSHEHGISASWGATSNTEYVKDYGTARTIAAKSHTHSSISTNYSDSSGGHVHVLSGAATATAVNEPMYRQLCAFTSNSDASEMPVGGITMWYGGTPPTKFKVCDGSNGTPDMRGYFLKINNSIDSGGSNAAHSHSAGGLSSSGSHVHSYNQKSSVSGTETLYGQTGGGTKGASNSHSHDISFNMLNSAETAHTHLAITSGTSVSTPPSTEVYFIQYTG